MSSCITSAPLQSWDVLSPGGLQRNRCNSVCEPLATSCFHHTSLGGSSQQLVSNCLSSLQRSGEKCHASAMDPACFTGAGINCIITLTTRVLPIPLLLPPHNISYCEKERSDISKSHIFVSLIRCSPAHCSDPPWSAVFITTL